MTTLIEDIRPITRRTDAREVALSVYDDLISLVASLEGPEWAASTECPGWDVSDMVGHLIGMGEACASVREMVRQQVGGRRHASEYNGNPLDAMNARQISKHASLSSAERVSRLREVAADAVKGRMATPSLVRAVTISVAPTGSTAGFPTKAKMGYLMDAILTRDAWLHRIDIARAIGRGLELSDVDARVVSDVVGEWARAHRQPVEVILGGPAGGKFVQGVGGERVEMDAVEFCRVLSGRAAGSGLLETKVWF